MVLAFPWIKLGQATPALGNCSITCWLRSSVNANTNFEAIFQRLHATVILTRPSCLARSEEKRKKNGSKQDSLDAGDPPDLLLQWSDWPSVVIQLVTLFLLICSPPFLIRLPTA